MGPEEESGFFSVATLAAQRIGGRLGEQQGALFFPTSLYPLSQGSQALTATLFLRFPFNSFPRVLAALGVNLSLEKQVTPTPFKQRRSLAGSLDVHWEGVSVLAVEGAGGDEHLRGEVSHCWLHGVDLRWAGARERAALRFSLRCCAPLAASEPLCSGCCALCKLAVQLLLGGPFGSSSGVLATDPRVVQPAPRESRPLGALEPTAIPPLSPPLLRCVWHRSSQQDVTIDSDYLGLSLLLANAYGRLTHEGEGFLFFKCSFPGSSFCTAVDRECCFSRKAAVGESFLVLFYDGGKKRSFSCMRYDGKARIPPHARAGRMGQRCEPA